MQAKFIVTNVRVSNKGRLMSVKAGAHIIELEHPRVLTHGTMLDDIVHRYMYKCPNIEQIALLNEIRYISQN